MRDSEEDRSLEDSARSLGADGWREVDILGWIHSLTAERDSLRHSHQGRPLSTADTARLRSFESALDQSWDLVRQRRARRAAGQGWEDLSQRMAELVASHPR